MILGVYATLGFFLPIAPRSIAASSPLLHGRALFTRAPSLGNKAVVLDREPGLRSPRLLRKQFGSLRTISGV
jgi:hypothetical protein